MDGEYFEGLPVKYAFIFGFLATPLMIIGFAALIILAVLLIIAAVKTGTWVYYNMP